MPLVTPIVSLLPCTAAIVTFPTAMVAPEALIVSFWPLTLMIETRPGAGDVAAAGEGDGGVGAAGHRIALPRLR